MTRILVVDDQRENLTLLSQALRSSIPGCELVEAVDGEYALGIALEPDARFDLIVTDVKMPEKDGYEFCREYRAARAGQEAATILMISGVFTESEDRTKGFHCGADGYLAKPYRLNELIAQVEVLLRIKRTEDELRHQAILRGDLKASEKRFQALFDASPEPAFVLRPDYFITDVNRAGRELLGPQMHAGADLIALLPEDQRRPVKEFIARNARGDAAEPPFEFTLSIPDASPRRLEVRSCRLDEPDGECLIVYLYDVTHRDAMEKRLRASETLKAIGHLAGGVAHDYNNLLTSILGFAHLVKNDLAEEGETRADVERIIEAAEEAGIITRKLMVFGQRRTLPLHPVDLNRATRNADSLMRRLIGEHIELVTLLGEDLATIQSDEQLIQNMLIDLVANARDAMHGGKILIETRSQILSAADLENMPPEAEAGRYSILQVSDEGVGIPKDIQDDVFVPFFSTKELKTRTIGLGLSTAYGIARQAGGFITLESEEGAGTVVTTWFPASGEPVLSSTSNLTPADQPAGGEETILVVEDEVHVLKLCTRLLDRLGYRVLQARNGHEALSVSRDHEGPIDLLLTDVVMPQMGGPELAGHLEKERPDTRVLYTSGYTANPLPLQNRNQQPPPFIMKPYTGNTMARKVREVLDAT